MDFGFSAQYGPAYTFNSNGFFKDRYESSLQRDGDDPALRGDGYLKDDYLYNISTDGTPKKYHLNPSSPPPGAGEEKDAASNIQDQKDKIKENKATEQLLEDPEMTESDRLATYEQLTAQHEELLDSCDVYQRLAETQLIAANHDS